MKRRKTTKPLTGEDKSLWKLVADTTTPLSLERGKLLHDEMSRLMGETSPLTKENQQSSPPLSYKALKKLAPQAKSSAQNFRNQNHKKIQQNHPIEDKTVKNLTKGRVVIDSRIDLHGMTQDRARYALMDFLQMAQRSGDKIVLVITGKGNDGLGVLRTNVPRWLGLPEFSGLVNGFRTSQSLHGGEGALYVRLRKPAVTKRT